MSRSPLRRARSRRRGRRRAYRGSVIHYLVALTLVPSIGLAVLSGIFIEDRLEDARVAGRVGAQMELVVELHELRSIIASESSASVLKASATRYGISMEGLADIIGHDLVRPVEPTRDRTDAALAGFRPDERNRATIERLPGQLRAARQAADRSFQSAEVALAVAWDMHAAFTEIDRALSVATQRTVQRIVDGDDGTGSNELLAAVSQMARVAAIVDVGIQEGVHLGALFTARTDDERVTALADLEDAAAVWRRSSNALSQHLSPAIRRSWEASVSHAQGTTMDDTIEALVESGLSADPTAPTAEAQEASVVVARLATDLRVLVREAADEGVAIAAADEASAQRRVTWAFAGTGLLLVAAVSLLGAIGGLLRRRLGSLAEAAERFSAGELDEMAVHGPREIAAASVALNDAVASFRQVSVQAERLSAGELDAPELQVAAPGALGTALQVSVQQIVSAARERERLQGELAHQASHDGLTHLPNRAETERLIEKALARAHRSEGSVAVLFVDLDHFKACNDTLGHAAGDQVLRTAADRMSAAVRPGDTVCRIGGDEFVVVIEPVGSDRSVVEIAERVAASLVEPMTYGEHTIAIGGSVGVAISDPSSDADSLLREADSAMYRAKATARGGVEVFNDALRAGLQDDADFRVAMADALVRDELELHYQPVLDIASGRLTAFEALARWPRPGIGMVGPDEFIPMAEKSGLILDIGEWALRVAAAQLVSWSADPAFASVKVAVNLSGRHLSQTRVVDDVRAALAASGLPADRLIIEITESVAIESSAAIDHLIALSDLGVLIALDDFGTGYTSIGQLLHLPIDILKIDRSLVSGTNEDGSPALGGSSRVVDLIIEIAHALDLDVVAEGVEDQSQLDTLAQAACESAQGYLLARPMPTADVVGWVAARQGGEVVPGVTGARRT